MMGKSKLTASSKRDVRPDYHDPTAGVGGAPAAASALTLRLVLALFGLVVLGALGGLALAVQAPGYAAVAWLLALTAAIDALVVRRRQAHER
jgi:uncharacterized membrane protein